MKIAVSIATEKVGSEITDILEIPDEEITGKTQEEIDVVCEETYKEWMWERIEGDWEVI